MSPATNLDQPDPVLRSTEHTNACKAAFNPKTLWETYGIVNEATVIPLVNPFGLTQT